jgi:mono/diheme cytochrome c family protein
MVSCWTDNKKPNFQYMPNMYEPVGYKTYGEYKGFPGEMEAMLPVSGSIPRGWIPYGYKNTPQGKELATKELKIPIEVNEENLSKGKELFNIYCAICHGNKGDGQGILVKREKFLGIPSLADKGRNITEGDIYHVMMYGLNNMGSYASQTNENERWQITMHALDLKSKLNGEPLWSSTQNEQTEKETTSEKAN